MNGKPHKLKALPDGTLVKASKDAAYGPQLEAWLTQLQKAPQPSTKDEQRKRQAEIQAGYSLLELVREAAGVWAHFTTEGDEEAKARLEAKYAILEQRVATESQEYADKFGRGDFTGTDPDVTDKVPGLYEGIGTETEHANWEFTDTWINPWTVHTWVKDPRGKEGHIRRHFDNGTGKLILDDANLEGLESNIPAKVALTSKGVPLVAFLQMRQFKLFEKKHPGLKFGEGNEIKSVKWSNIANVETVLELQGRMNAGETRDEALAKTHSVRYAMTPLVQTGHELVPGSVRFDMAGGNTKKIGELLSDKSNARYDNEQKLLKTWNLSLNESVPWMFDIHAKVTKGK